MFLFFVLVTAARLWPQSELLKEILANFFVELLTTILVPYIYIYGIYIILKIAHRIKRFIKKWRVANAFLRGNNFIFRTRSEIPAFRWA